MLYLHRCICLTMFLKVTLSTPVSLWYSITPQLFKMSPLVSLQNEICFKHQGGVSQNLLISDKWHSFVISYLKSSASVEKVIQSEPVYFCSDFVKGNTATKHGLCRQVPLVHVKIMHGKPFSRGTKNVVFVDRWSLKQVLLYYTCIFL